MTAPGAAAGSGGGVASFAAPAHGWATTANNSINSQLAGGGNKKPRVLLLDLDGTMVGKVMSAACEVELLRLTGAARGARMKAARDEIVARLRYGIIRPHLEAFCRNAAAAGDVELFVYTASEATWATFLVGCVEAALGTKFNRPIFTRNHCVSSPTSPVPELRKSIARVLPAVAARLRRKYPGVRSAADLRDRVALVDNTPGILLPPSEE